MKFVKSIVVASFVITASAQANCGNNKPVGNGCTTEPVSTNPVAVTAPMTNNNNFTATTTVPVNSTVITGDTSNVNRNNLNSSNVATGGSSSSVSTNRNNNMATGGAASSTSGANATGGTGGVANVTTSNTAAGGAGGSANSAVSGNTVQSNSEINVSNTSVTNVPRPAVASAIAPNTIFSGGMDSCMGSSTGSVQGMSFGVAIGSTWTDNHCVALRAAVRLNELGFKNTAAARLCAIPEIAEAFRKSGEFNCGE